MNYTWFWFKAFFLTVYHGLIYHFLGPNDAMLYKFISFNTITPVAKYYRMFNKLDTKSDQGKFVFSVAHDLAMSTMLYFVFIVLRGNWYLSHGVLMMFLLFVGEWMDHKFIIPAEPYVFKVGPKLVDNLMPATAMTAYWAMIRTMDFQKPPDYKSFPVFLVTMFTYDVGFGVVHFVGHCVPFLHKRHMIHHQYKKEELSAAANFCFDYLDGLILLTASYGSACLWLCWFGYHHHVMSDLSYCAG